MQATSRQFLSFQSRIIKVICVLESDFLSSVNIINHGKAADKERAFVVIISTMLEPGTVLFPSDPERSIEILWNDVERKTDPSSLTIRGNKSRWKALHDISLGTTLKQLERLNGRPFHMAGYGWDYSGTVLSWDEGTLKRDLGQFDPQEGVEHGRVILRLNCNMESGEPLTKEEAMQVAGDRRFSSNHPVLQKMNPCVSEMVWLFPQKAKN